MNGLAILLLPMGVMAGTGASSGPIAGESSTKNEAGPCPASLAAAEEMLSRISPIMTVTTYVAPPETAGATLADGSYRTRSGIIMDAGCINAGPRFTPKYIEATLREMLNGVARCARNRALSSVQVLFNDAVARHPRIDCDASTCGANAAACAGRAENRIHLKVFPQAGGAETWFHEMLHMSGADNQCTVDHNNRDHSGRDEVYFWSQHCFTPQKMVDDVRSDPNACRTPLRTNAIASRFHYNAREVEAICSIYDNYLRDEKIYVRNVNTLLVPEIISCAPHLDGRPCPNVPALNARLTAAGLDAGVIPTSTDTQALITWAHDQCYLYNSGWLTNPADALYSCASRLSYRLPDTLNEKVAAGLLTRAEADSALAAINAIREKSKFVVEGPGDVGHFPELSNSGQGSTHLAKSIDACDNRAGLAGTSLCNVFNSQMKRPMAGMLRYWQ